MVATRRIYMRPMRDFKAQSPLCKLQFLPGGIGWQRTERGCVQSTSRSAHFNPCVIRLPRAAAGPADTAALRQPSVIKLNLVAHLRQTLFTAALVCQRIGVRAPEFFHHLALRHEWTFRLQFF